jgi:hypothetical protein
MKVLKIGATPDSDCCFQVIWKRDPEIYESESIKMDSNLH